MSCHTQMYLPDVFSHSLIPIHANLFQIGKKLESLYFAADFSLWLPVSNHLCYWKLTCCLQARFYNFECDCKMQCQTVARVLDMDKGGTGSNPRLAMKCIEWPCPSYSSSVPSTANDCNEDEIELLQVCHSKALRKKRNTNVIKYMVSWVADINLIVFQPI